MKRQNFIWYWKTYGKKELLFSKPINIYIIISKKNDFSNIMGLNFTEETYLIKTYNLTLIMMRKSTRKIKIHLT